MTYLQALSNIVFCYFPITFRPPPNDPYGITADDLRLALRYGLVTFSEFLLKSFHSGCLNATPAFGPFALPIFLEKLAAGSPAIKVRRCVCYKSPTDVFGSETRSKP